MDIFDVINKMSGFSVINLGRKSIENLTCRHMPF